MGWVYDDGGRAAAGYKGHTGDCVVRAIAIASGLPYQEVYDECAEIMAGARKTKRRPKAGKRSARNGIYTGTAAFKRYMAKLGFTWTPTMRIGSGCTVHLRADELPGGRLVVSVSRHLTAMLDGVIHDTYDPRRGSTVYYKSGCRDSREAVVDRIVPESRCVYGYWSLSR